MYSPGYSLRVLTRQNENQRQVWLDLAQLDDVGRESVDDEPFLLHAGQQGLLHVVTRLTHPIRAATTSAESAAKLLSQQAKSFRVTQVTQRHAPHSH